MYMIRFENGVWDLMVGQESQMVCKACELYYVKV